jgi:hypothetical protein
MAGQREEAPAQYRSLQTALKGHAYAMEDAVDAAIERLKRK